MYAGMYSQDDRLTLKPSVRMEKKGDLSNMLFNQMGLSEYLRNCWSGVIWFPTQLPLWFTENGQKKKKYTSLLKIPFSYQRSQDKSQMASSWYE